MGLSDRYRVDWPVGGPVGPRAAASFRLRSIERLRVRSLRKFLRKLAMFFGGRGMVLRLIVLTARVVVLGLMMVMRGCMVVAGRSVMMLLRRMFCHFSVLRRTDLGWPM